MFLCYLLLIAHCGQTEHRVSRNGFMNSEQKVSYVFTQVLKYYKMQQRILGVLGGHSPNVKSKTGSNFG